MSDITVTHARDKQRYEAWMGEDLAGFAEYSVSGDVVTMPHTEVDPSFEGKGVASALVREALDDVRSQGRTVRPQCSFVAAWIERHDDYAPMVATS